MGQKEKEKEKEKAKEGGRQGPNPWKGVTFDEKK